MYKCNTIGKRLCAVVLGLTLLFVNFCQANAASFSTLPAGTYNINASLSCYVNAMGGVEFGAPMLTSAKVKVASNGSKTITIGLRKSQVDIYGVVCDTFVDAAPAGASAIIGYYNASGSLVTSGVSHTLSSDTAQNSQQNMVRYVNSITFPVDRESSTYNLALYINSNVMGTQFSNDTYKATLTVDWSSVYSQVSDSSGGSSGGSNAGSANPSTGTSNNTGSSQSTGASGGESQTAGDPSNVEEMDGLSIYRADDDGVEEEAGESVDSVLAFNKPLMLGMGLAALLLVIGGLILVAAGYASKSKQLESEGRRLAAHEKEMEE